MNNTTPQKITHNEAETLCRRLMAEHGVDKLGWVFKWSNGVRQMGCVYFRTVRCRFTGRVEKLVQELRLSRNLVRLNGVEEVTDVILHEIAHILAGLSHGHDHVWKAMCRKIGARPEMYCSTDRVATVPHKYHVVCGCCGKTVQKRHKLAKVGYFDRRYCGNCGPKSLGTIKVLRVA